MYEAVRSDRNLYSKNLIESQDEIAEMKRKFKIMHHQIEQLKEEIQQKDQVRAPGGLLGGPAAVLDLAAGAVLDLAAGARAGVDVRSERGGLARRGCEGCALNAGLLQQRQPTQDGDARE